MSRPPEAQPPSHRNLPAPASRYGQYLGCCKTSQAATMARMKGESSRNPSEAVGSSEIVKADCYPPWKPTVDSYKPKEDGRLSRSNSDCSSRPKKRKRKRSNSPTTARSHSKVAYKQAPDVQNSLLPDQIDHLSAQVNRLENKLDQIIEYLKIQKPSQTTIPVLQTGNQNQTMRSNDKSQPSPWRAFINALTDPPNTRTSFVSSRIPPSAAINASSNRTSQNIDFQKSRQLDSSKQIPHVTVKFPVLGDSPQNNHAAAVSDRVLKPVSNNVCQLRPATPATVVAVPVIQPHSEGGIPFLATNSRNVTEDKPEASGQTLHITSITSGYPISASAEYGPGFRAGSSKVPNTSCNAERFHPAATTASPRVSVDDYFGALKDTLEEDFIPFDS